MRKVKHPSFGTTFPGGRLADVVATLTDDEAQRAAVRSVGDWDSTVALWPSRGALLTTVRMQERRERRRDDWRPLR